MKNRLIAFLLCLVVLLGFCLGGCDTPSVPQTNDILEPLDLQLDTVHGGKAEKTNEWFLKNGSTEYKIVLSANATSNETKTATVIQRYFYEATNFSLPIITDVGLSYTTISKYLSVGNTVLSQAVSLGYEYEDESNAGFQIITKGQTIFLFGGEYGIVYAGYELCYYWFGLDYYADYCYSLDKNVTDLALYDFDIRELPDFRVNNPAFGQAIFAEDTNLKTAWRYDRQDTSLNYNTLWGNMHNTFKIVPWKENGVTHRNWYSKDVQGNGEPYQLCFSRDPDGLCEYVLEKFKESAIALPDIDILPFSHEDIKAWCKCDECLVLEEQYDGCQTVGYVRFLRKLADQLNAWGKETLGRDLKVQALAYNPTEDVPARYNEQTGEYEPIDETCDLGENVYIYYCPHPDYYVPIDDPVNEKIWVTLKSWSALTPCMYIFLYNCTMYPNYFVFTGSFGAMQRNYQLIKKYHGQSLYDLGPYDTPNSSAFNGLKTYLSAKLAWNCQLDFNELVNRYFENYFDVAAEPMRNMYEACMNKLMYLWEEGKVDWNWKRFVLEDVYYSEGFLNTLMAFIDQAYALIDPLENTNPELYYTLYQRINLESLSPRYLQIEMYSTKYSPDVLLDKKLSFKNDCTNLKITRLGESAMRTIDTVYKSWGIA